MYEEPYRWVEAVGNRRHYLDEQFKQGSPVVAVSYPDGIVLLTVSRGTPKLYEIYDRLALGGMGHPADLEKLRFTILELAHTEGFNRSPSDVTGARLVKYGLAPVIKQAFEEVYKAPFIVKMLLAELGSKPGRDTFVTVDYDGGFEETTGSAVLAATAGIQAGMAEHLTNGSPPMSLADALEVAMRVWAIGSLAQEAHASNEHEDESRTEAKRHEAPDTATLTAHVRQTLGEKTLECALLDRQMLGSSKYRAMAPAELDRLLPSPLRSA